MSSWTGQDKGGDIRLALANGGDFSLGLSDGGDLGLVLINGVAVGLGLDDSNNFWLVQNNDILGVGLGLTTLLHLIVPCFYTESPCLPVKSGVDLIVLHPPGALVPEAPVLVHLLGLRRVLLLIVPGGNYESILWSFLLLYLFLKHL